MQIKEIPENFRSLPQDLDRKKLSLKKYIGPYRLGQPLPLPHHTLNIVYNAFTPHHEVVAIKIPLSSHPDALEVFEREIETSKQVSELTTFVPRFVNQGIERFETLPHDAIHGEKEFPFFVMEYIPGGSFQQMIYHTQLGIPETVNALRSVVEAVTVFGEGEQGLIHRDLTSLNMLRRNTGELVVVDFGYAIRKGAKTSYTLGPPFLRSPEMVTVGAEITPASDAWQLGATAYKALREGEHLVQLVETPHEVANESQVALQNGNYRDVIENQLKAASLKAPAREVFHHILAQDPQERSTAREFIDELDKVA